MTHTALVAGAGTGSDFASTLARALCGTGRRVRLLVRREETRSALAEQLADVPEDRIRIDVVDLLDRERVRALVARYDDDAPIDVLVHAAGRLDRAPFADASPETFLAAWQANVGTALPISEAVFAPMAARHAGSVIFTGATASVRGGADFAPFAAAKFALRGLAQSLARAYGPKGIHVAHVVVDGVIWGARARDVFGLERARCIDPAALASVYRDLIEQPDSAWTHEIDVRPSSERF